MPFGLIEPILAGVMRGLSHNNFTKATNEVHQIWDEIPKDSLERLYDGMTRCVDASMRLTD